MSDRRLTAARWNAEYRDQRYVDEPPLPFVGRIVETLRAEDVARTGIGLYVGCGNGRNYVPLIDAGLDLVGIDISPEALKALAARRPAAAPRLICDDFRTFEPDRFFLRVNAASTQIYHAYTVVERDPLGGLTIRYDDGPKRGLLIHFFSEAELRHRLQPFFDVALPPREDVTVRDAPKTGSWAQWESVWRRRH